ncbi:hypothetical protein NN3_32180 [Nocardia neocaledoniensis NBRC 108232]|uniref:DUF2716 domain-containing protein n=1 Tax=Nocardia neocaledoniensis TaxID=236511 RepID=A0A317P0H3_9NOCA|nr:hypothetical protein [Nocardia neocaledoniensis]PWV80733.1 hypothetical protein DFR69_10169 [Nocardia neocaledoniensis]GEM32211.1 hypothetical protein NN3_32180 [Nocardia neocaledoniensis NBRC 108232]
MTFALCRDAAAADWLLHQELPWHRLAARGPAGYQRYARLRFAPDPRFPGQRLNDVRFDQPELSEKQQIGIALETLARSTTTPETCYFAVWNGWSTITIDTAPTLRIPHRDYWLLRGALADFADWNSGDSARWPFGDCPDPAFIWPADRAWCVTDDVDPHFASIGAAAEAIDRLVADPRIDAVRDDPAAEPPSWC